MKAKSDHSANTVDGAVESMAITRITPYPFENENIETTEDCCTTFVINFLFEYSSQVLYIGDILRERTEYVYKVFLLFTKFFGENKRDS